MSMGRTFVRAGIICFAAALLNLAIGSRAMTAQQSGSKGQSADAADENQAAVSYTHLTLPTNREV